MTKNNFNPKLPWVNFLKEQRENLIRASEFYEKLEKSIKPDEQWKVLKTSKFFGDIGDGDIVPPDIELPSSLLEKAIRTVDEYLSAIEEFSDDQFTAFLLGIGFNWLDLPYWGIDVLSDYYIKINKAIAYYEKLESNIPSEDHWKIEKNDPFNNPTDLTPNVTKLPSVILKRLKEFIESSIHVLSDRPF